MTTETDPAAAPRRDADGKPPARPKRETAPPPVPEPPCADCGRGKEGLLAGLLLCGVALGLAFIGLDLITGGRLSGPRAGDGDDGRP